MIKVKKVFGKVDLSQIGDGSVEGEVYVLLNPSQEVLDEIGETGIKLSEWFKPPKGQRNKEAGQSLLKHLIELWGNLLSLDGINLIGADGVTRLRRMMPRYMWTALTAEAMKLIGKHEEDVSKKVIG